MAGVGDAFGALDAVRIAAAELEHHNARENATKRALALAVVQAVAEGADPDELARMSGLKLPTTVLTGLGYQFDLEPRDALAQWVGAEITRMIAGGEIGG